jgi:hypothetical protein
MPWNIIPYISTPISLLALALVIIYYLKREKIKSDIEKLKGLNSKDKSDLLPILEEKYDLRTGDLTKEQRFELAKSQLAEYSKKHRSQLFFYGFIAVLFAGIIIFSVGMQNAFKQDIKNNANPSENDGKQSGITYNKLVTPPAVNSLKLIFTTHEKGITDTITTPLNLTPKELMKEIIANSDIETQIRKNNKNIAGIDWSIKHQLKVVPQEEMDRNIGQLAWQDFDYISLQCQIMQFLSRKIEHDTTKRIVDPRPVVIDPPKVNIIKKPGRIISAKYKGLHSSN